MKDNKGYDVVETLVWEPVSNRGEQKRRERVEDVRYRDASKF